MGFTGGAGDSHPSSPRVGDDGGGFTRGSFVTWWNIVRTEESRWWWSDRCCPWSSCCGEDIACVPGGLLLLLVVDHCCAMCCSSLPSRHVYGLQKSNTQKSFGKYRPYRCVRKCDDRFSLNMNTQRVFKFPNSPLDR